MKQTNLLVDVMHHLHYNSDFIHSVKKNAIHQKMPVLLCFVKSFNMIELGLPPMVPITNKEHHILEIGQLRNGK